MTAEEREEFIQQLICAVHGAQPAPAAPAQLTEEEQQWVRMAIQREAQSIKLRQAVIEKTLAGLVWMAISGALVYVGNQFMAHWK